MASAPLDLRLPAELAEAVAARVASEREERVPERVWAKDPTLWAPEGTPEVANRLGWLDLPASAPGTLADLASFRDELLAEGMTDAVVLGMGGSSLAPEVFRRSFADSDRGLRLRVLDSTDPGAVLGVQRQLDLDRTLFLVSTKSGGTIETLSLFRHFHEAVGGEGRHFAAITDPGSSLQQLAKDNGFRRTFLNDPNIGGRYSALSHFGLVPAALAGVPVGALLESAGAAAEACRLDEGNPGLWLGALWGEAAKAGRDKVTWIVSPPLVAFGLWVEQLIAESTGKEGKGILPVAGEPLGAPTVYGEDRLFVHVALPGDEAEAGVAALAEAGHPVVVLPVSGPEELGELFMLTEWATAEAGRVLGINPFDQPNVQEAKDQTASVLGGYSDNGELPVPEPADEAGLRRFLAELRPGRYGAIMAYLPPSEAFDQAEGRLRAMIRDAKGAAVTFGYGPRFLHSTGQLHKGGPASGSFLQLVGPLPEDLPIPDALHSFGTLRDAQAIGDLETLRAHGLGAEQVRLEGDPVEALESLIATMEAML